MSGGAGEAAQLNVSLVTNRAHCARRPGVLFPSIPKHATACGCSVPALVFPARCAFVTWTLATPHLQ